MQLFNLNISTLQKHSYGILVCSCLLVVKSRIGWCPVEIVGLALPCVAQVARVGDETFRLCSNHVDDMITVSTVPWMEIGDLTEILRYRDILKIYIESKVSACCVRLCRVCHFVFVMVCGKLLSLYA